MRVLVTGSAGFIGSHLCKFLVEQGYEVHGVDSLVHGEEWDRTPKGVYKHSVSLIKGYGKRILRDIEPEIVVHLAALGGVPKSFEFPGDYFSHNVSGFSSLIEASRQCGVKKLVYASSSSVYGDCSDLSGLQSEFMTAIRPKSPYGVTKSINEIQAKSYRDFFSFDAVGLRFFNVYGPNQKIGSGSPAISKWIDLASKGENLRVYGQCSRSFTYVADVVLAIYRAIFHDMGGWHVYNVANPETVSTWDVASRIANHFKVDVIQDEGRHGDTIKSKPCTKLAFDELGFKAQVSWQEGVDYLCQKSSVQ